MHHCVRVDVVIALLSLTVAIGTFVVVLGDRRRP